MTTEQWVTVAQAAATLQKSERTIRRWIEADKIQHKKSMSGIVVDIAELLPAEDDAKPTNKDTAPADTDTLVRLAKLEAENELLREDRDYLRQALAAAMETTQNLITAGGPGVDAGSAETSPGRGQAAPGNAGTAPGNKSWWQRMFGRD